MRIITDKQFRKIYGHLTVCLDEVEEPSFAYNNLQHVLEILEETEEVVANVIVKAQ